MNHWLLAGACVAIIVFLLLQKTSASKDKSTERLALFVGARRAWGESDASLRRRSVALSRWPFKQDAPVVAWWARLFRKS